MKKILIAMSILLLPVFTASFSTSALALEEGDDALCVVLDTLGESGVNGSRCIREPEEGAESKRYTIVKFFSVFCSDCEKLHQDFINKLPNKIIQNAAINYISLDRDISDLANYIRVKAGDIRRLEASVFHDGLRDAKNAYGVFSTPTTFVLDRNEEFKIVYKHIGTMNDQEFERFTSSIQTSCPAPSRQQD